MKLFKLFYVLIALVTIGFISSCTKDDDKDTTKTDTFNREVMLTSWADNIIIPSYQAFNADMNDLKEAADAFETAPNVVNLEALRRSWETAYVTWQNVSMFNIGPAETSFFRSFLNTYPTSTATINTNISTGAYNLQDINLNDAQGFPALDYLLFGLADTNEEVLTFYSGANGVNYLTYLTDVVDRMEALSNQVLLQWEDNYKPIFISSNGASSNSSTNSLVNDWMEYYEVAFRNGKIGFPAGVFSDGATGPERVEAFYKGDLSKTLCLEALNAIQRFFKGDHFNGSGSGPSLESYLDFLNTVKNGEDVSALINTQFNASRTAINSLNDSFSNQINTDNNAMLSAFEALQSNVVLLKSDMFSALSIAVEFNSGDGD